VGGQVWSDYIKSSSCQVGSFRANVDINSKDVGIVLCRPGDQNQGSLFTWCAIGLFSDQICPTGYHMPSPEEFCDLDKTLFGRGNCNSRDRKDDNYLMDLAKYRTDWGANLSRMCQSNENTDNEPIGLGYMGDWFWSGTRGRSLQLIEGPNESSDNDWVINPNASRDIHNGLSIRCIKN
jgi:uncharacterized protein (TIGR02145 family)